FIGEIYRGSIAGVDRGQFDAAYALGLSFTKTMRLIILPQAFRISVPALSNVAMDLLKGTSLAAMITIPDIFQKAKIVGGRTFDYMSMYVLVAIIYWLLCILIEAGQKRLEQHFSKRFAANEAVRQ
ncbi:ABC transporter permease subunit, partial [Listeria monocytogenes]|nr:ABC transporter permease subunit [Listeria monocytogenes]